MNLRLTVKLSNKQFLLGSSKQSECEWLERVYELLKKETLGDEDYISADFATMQPPFT